ncbi:NAD(P)H-binding protein [Streptomyces sp. YIM 98790]|uniref:NAD(P)H-binding protein n=1 Tax=Streptomyces sp. YIM 98790 TaxID=2689077 RepID=UPI00140CA624|nr:NAD(P)H-binding protein [Streptomyces sp. YIM 98790]
MRIVIAGGHGKIALRLERLLSTRGDEVAGLIRDPAQSADLLAAGAQPLVCDLETASADTVTQHLTGADAAVFAAGAGPGSGAPRKDSVDRAAQILFTDAAERAGVRRFLSVSAMRVDLGADPPPGMDPVFAAYLRAKAAAEEDLRSRTALYWTILRPGRLTDEPGTGRVTLGPSVERGDVTRDDVAAVLLALLDAPATAGRTLELTNGPTPITTALSALTADA